MEPYPPLFCVQTMSRYLVCVCVCVCVCVLHRMSGAVTEQIVPSLITAWSWGQGGGGG